MCIYMAESLRCSPQTITMLLIGYTPTQNKEFLFCFFKGKEYSRHEAVRMSEIKLVTFISVVNKP